jgi:hypothetical protein
MIIFDYKLAWKELALPQFLTLPSSIKLLAKKVAKESFLLKQESKTLNVPWANEKLKNSFEKLDSEALANAAKIIYCFGHWRPEPWPKEVKNFTNLDSGWHWKFSNYADQILRTRSFNRSYDKNPKFGIGYSIHQGLLRITFSNSDSWIWEEIGLATENNYKEVISMVDNSLKDLNQIEVTMQVLKKHFYPNGPIGNFLNLSKYMVEG